MLHPSMPAGGALIKYGSLLSDVAFDANSLLAALLVALPPASYAVYMLLASRDEASQ